MQELWLGDSFDLISRVEDESVNLVFTDPIYENISDYHWLGQQGERVLKPNSPMLVWVSKKSEYECRQAIEKSGLKWVWTLNYTVIAKTSRLMHYHLYTWTTPCLWFNKGTFKPNPWVVDTFISNSPRQGTHKWNKNNEVSLCWINSFSKPGDLILDPFCGSGTNLITAKKLNRNFIGMEKEEKTYQYAQKRLKEIEIQAFPYQYDPHPLF